MSVVIKSSLKNQYRISILTIRKKRQNMINERIKDKTNI